jgi:hypothetical protein
MQDAPSIGPISVKGRACGDYNHLHGRCVSRSTSTSKTSRCTDGRLLDRLQLARVVALADAGQRTPNAYYEVFDRRISLAGMR